MDDFFYYSSGIRFFKITTYYGECLRIKFHLHHLPQAHDHVHGTGRLDRIRQAVVQGLAEFAPLHLNPVDEMVAGYGRALRVLSEQWPVIDGDEPVGPVRTMIEASRVVAEHQIQRITKGALQVTDLSPEAAMALTLFGIYGLLKVPFGEALSLSHSLNIELAAKTGGYAPNGRFIGINTAAAGSRRPDRAKAEDTGFHAPLVKKGSKLRLATPEERRYARLEQPQTEWDILHGVIMAFREGDVPVARAYLDRHAPEKKMLIRHLLTVWAAEVPDDTPVSILHDFYIPVLGMSVAYDRVAGYFRSSSLAAASQGFFAFTRAGGGMRLVVGADLEAHDVQAILDGDAQRLAGRLNQALGEPSSWPKDVCQGVTLLAWIVAHGFLGVRVAFRVHGDTGKPLPFTDTSDGYVHEKWAIFTDAIQHHININS